MSAVPWWAVPISLLGIAQGLAVGLWRKMGGRG